MSRDFTVRPICESWLRKVVPLLERGDPSVIVWSISARQYWEINHPIGSREEAYQHILRTLENHGTLGHEHNYMQDRDDLSICTTWEFLCPHPFRESTKPVYVKIGLHQRVTRLNIFSLHEDRNGALSRAIEKYRKKHAT